MPKYIGIDLGTTFTQGSLCQTSAWNNDAPETQMLRFPGFKERLRFPSMVYYPGKGEPPVAGEKAEEQWEYLPKQVLRESKSRLINEEFLQMTVDVGGEIITENAQDVSSTVLNQAVSAMCDRNNALIDWSDIAGCTITYPASFPYNALKYTKAAAQRVTALTSMGEKEPPTLFFLPEPIAAFIGLVYSNHKIEFTPNEIVLVVDIGAGTTDTTVIRIKEISNGRPAVEILEVGEHILQGGNDYDNTVAEYLSRKLWPEPIDEGTVQKCGRADYSLALQRFWYTLLLIAREIKEYVLSEEGKEEVFDISKSEYYREPYLSKVAELYGVAKSTELTLKSDELTADLLATINHPVGNTLAAGLQRLEDRYRHSQNCPLEPSKIILAGGGSQIRAVRNLLEARYHVQPTKPANPHQLIAHGAGIYASMTDEDRAKWRWPINKDVYLIVQDQNGRNTWQKIWGREHPEGEYDYTVPAKTESVKITVGAGFFDSENSIDRITDQFHDEVSFPRAVLKNESVRLRTWIDHASETPYMQLMLNDSGEWKAVHRPMPMNFQTDRLR